MSDAKDWNEMMEKRALYREAGAEEAWVVSTDGTDQFLTDEERAESKIAPDFPCKIGSFNEQ